MREFELDSPVGYTGRDKQGREFEIIGVVSDFYHKSLHEVIEPCIYNWQAYLNMIIIRINSNNIPATLKSINKEVNEIMPDVVFDSIFLDEALNQHYIRDEKNAKIIGFMAMVSIFIACLGLFGLSSFMATRRTKEIGIRKVLGASEESVFLLLSKEFIKWVILAISTACPIAWFIMNKWLKDFAYHIHIEWWIFLVSILISFLVTFLTVTWQSLKTARINPTDSLRYE